MLKNTKKQSKKIPNYLRKKLRYRHAHRLNERYKKADKIRIFLEKLGWKIEDIDNRTVIALRNNILVNIKYTCCAYRIRCIDENK